MATAGFNGKCCFLSRAWAPTVKQAGREVRGKFQTEQRTDSCKVGVGWGLLDKQDPEKLTSFSPDRHLNIALGSKLQQPERKT